MISIIYCLQVHDYPLEDTEDDDVGKGPESAPAEGNGEAYDDERNADREVSGSLDVALWRNALMRQSVLIHDGTLRDFVASGSRSNYGPVDVSHIFRLTHASEAIRPVLCHISTTHISTTHIVGFSVLERKAHFVSGAMCILVVFQCLPMKTVTCFFFSWFSQPVTYMRLHAFSLCLNPWQPPQYPLLPKAVHEPPDGMDDRFLINASSSNLADLRDLEFWTSFHSSCTCRQDKRNRCRFCPTSSICFGCQSKDGWLNKRLRWRASGLLGECSLRAAVRLAADDDVPSFDDCLPEVDKPSATVAFQASIRPSRRNFLRRGHSECAAKGAARMTGRVWEGATWFKRVALCARICSFDGKKTTTNGKPEMQFYKWNTDASKIAASAAA